MRLGLAGLRHDAILLCSQKGGNPPDWTIRKASSMEMLKHAPDVSWRSTSEIAIFNSYLTEVAPS